MAKNFKKNNPLTQMEGSNKAQNTALSETASIPEEKTQSAAISKEKPTSEEKTIPAAVHTEPSKPVEPSAGKIKEKRPPGRPKVKEGDYRTINISVPVPMLEQMEIAKLKYGSLTAYANHAIQADLDANYQKYLEIYKMING